MLPSGVDHITLCVAPSRSRGDDHAALYPAAARGAVRLAEALGARTLLYTSSTGVYGTGDGSDVDENTSVGDADDRQRALVDAERTVLEAGGIGSLRPIVLRVAGLYGPGRDPARRFRGADAPAEPQDDRWCNFAWRDDVVAAALHLQTAPDAELRHAIFNCADGHPVRASAVSEALGAPPASGLAERGARSSASPLVRRDRRVSVERLLATGWSPEVPTVFHGLALLGHDLSAT